MNPTTTVLTFAVVSPDDIALFAFTATSQAQADAKISEWNRTQGFRCSAARHTAERINACDLDCIGIEIHNERI